MRLALGALTGVLTALLWGDVAHATFGGGDDSATVTVRAAVVGELADGVVGSNPCAGNGGATEYWFVASGNFRSGTVEYTFDQGSDFPPESLSAQWFARGSGPGDVYAVIDAATYSTITVTERQYVVGCRDPDTGVVDEATRGLVWVPVISEVTLIPDVMAELVKVVPAPEVFFPVADPVFGWLYVKTPMEVRVSNLDEVSAVVTAANAVSSATATATAVPVEVVFESGEPGGGRVVCSVEAVQMGWDRNDPDGSGCVYSYANSSAVTPSDRFQAHTVVRWHVTGTGGLDMTIETQAFDVVAVAEVQAVVVAR